MLIVSKFFLEFSIKLSSVNHDKHDRKLDFIPQGQLVCSSARDKRRNDKCNYIWNGFNCKEGSDAASFDMLAGYVLIY